MINFRILTSALIVTTSIYSGCGKPTDLDQEKILLLNQDKQWSDVISGTDMDKILDYWTEDAVIYPSQGPAVRGKDEIRNIMERNRIKWGLALKTEPQEALVFESGDVGYTVGTYDFFGTDANGDSVDLPGKYLSIWQKDSDSKWKCVLEFHSASTEPIDKLLNQPTGGS